MKFKTFLDTTPIEEGWLSKMFSKAPQPAQPKMLRYGDKKSPAKSYGTHSRSAAVARKWDQIRAEGDAERSERDARMR